MARLLLASFNAGKVREYRALFGNLGYQMVTLAEEGISEVATESGTSYEQNAEIKACTYAKLAGLVTIADDSGLEVDALGGKPGLHSARFAGQHATDADRVGTLLAKLEGVPREKRTAHFKCVIAIATATGLLDLCHGECHGLITLEPEGGSGFGYDPVFYLPEAGKTLAELPLEIKNQFSHRGRASQRARQVLKQLHR
ncbi:MAG: RdgB/HAM1 family non-canonical purine NTP pyrophosphatase [Chloroflexota bacterium]|nr:RdgB/HAM1 family non-canonical purine NTP pyrophosphatase [Chloroflexota bacterium]